MLALQGRPHLNLNRAKAWVTADSSGWIAKPLRKILDYGGRRWFTCLWALGEKKNIAGFHIYNLLQCCGTFWEDPFWDMGICGNGLLSTSVRSGGRKKIVWVPPARQQHILPSRAVILGKVQSCKQPTRHLENLHGCCTDCFPCSVGQIPENFTKKYNKRNDFVFILCLTLLPPNYCLLVCPRCGACSFKQRPVQPAVRHC